MEFELGQNIKIADVSGELLCSSKMGVNSLDLFNHVMTDEGRVELFEILRKLVFAITSKISRIPMEYIRSKDSSESKLQIDSICCIKFSIL